MLQRQLSQAQRGHRVRVCVREQSRGLLGSALAATQISEAGHSLVHKRWAGRGQFTDRLDSTTSASFQLPCQVSTAA